MMRVILYIVLVGLLCVGIDVYTERTYQEGRHAESVQRDAIDRVKTATAEQERYRLNARINDTQAVLDLKIAHIVELEKDAQNEKAISSKRDADLRAGVARERVLIRAVSTADRAPAPNGSLECSAAAGVGAGSGVEADLDPGVAGWLERVRGSHNAAVERLGACIAAYDAVKAAADRMP